MIKYETGKKETKNPFGKDWFYLGRNQDNKKVFLENFSWDCSWYWSGGYLEEPNRDYTDINSHSHFSGLNEYKNQDLKSAFDEQFKDTPLTEKEVWILCDLMSQFYALQKCAEVYKNGGHYTSDAFRFNKKHGKKQNSVINEDIQKRIARVRVIWSFSE